MKKVGAAIKKSAKNLDFAKKCCIFALAFFELMTASCDR